MKIEISEELFTRLQNLATPFVDTPESVIERALTHLENVKLKQPVDKASKPRITDDRRIYTSYAELPSVKHTKPKSVSIDGVEHIDSTWSGINQWLHTRAVALVGVDEMLSISKANIKKGMKEENGFDYIPKIGCSMQRSDASTTLRQICYLAQALDFNVSLSFEWKDHTEAAYPTESASLELKPLSEGIAK